jgi:hypothetical protein
LEEIRGKLSVTAIPYSLAVSAQGNTTVASPSSGKKLRVKFLDVANDGSGDVTVAFRFGDSGDLRFKKVLGAKRFFLANLTGCDWEGAVDEVLKVNLSVSGSVDVTVFAEEV